MGFVVGVDESGVGSLLGIMTASAVIVGESSRQEDYKDSKRVPPSKREKIYTDIMSTCHVGRGCVTNFEIDELGMGRCRRLVFERALDDLKIDPVNIEKIIVDGTIFGGWRDCEYECIPKADVTHPCVSAASIIAKVDRDRYVYDICDKYPCCAKMYKWRSNKGYPSQHHREAIKTYGDCHLHRKSFNM